MTFQSAHGYVLFETGPACTILRAALFGKVLLEWRTHEEWAARPQDAPRWEFEARRDVDALKGYRQTVLVLGRYTLTYWPWEVVRKLLLLNRRATRRTAPELPPPPRGHRLTRVLRGSATLRDGRHGEASDDTEGTGGSSVAYRLSLTTVAGLGLAFSLVVCSGVAAQPLSATTAAPPSDAQIRSELRRLNTMRTTCLGQAQQAVTLQRAASAGGRLSEAEAYAQTLREKMACVDKTSQDLVRLQTQAGPTKAALFVSEDRFHQEYRQALHAQLGVLQRLGGQLAGREAVTYEVFAQQMDALRRQTDTFKNRYIRLLNESDTRDLAKAVFQASDLLVASAQSWKAQVKAEIEIVELAPKGPSAQLARAEAVRDNARTQRAAQWEAAQQLVSQATAFAAAQ